MTSMELVHVPGYGRSENAQSNARSKAGPGRPRGQRKLEVEQRRMQVAALYLSKRSGREIARQLNVSHRTVRKDLDIIRANWRATSTRDFDAAVAEEEAKLDGMERALMPRALMGEKNAVADMLKIADRRARLKGYDKPAKLEVSGSIDIVAKKARAAELLDAVDELEARRRAG